MVSHDVEKGSLHNTEESPTSTEVSNQDYHADDGFKSEHKTFVPIRTTRPDTVANEGGLSRAQSASSRSMTRTRSNNGYGCDDDDVEGGTPQSNDDGAFDPYEVKFDKGNQDPDCPRSMPRAKKWLIVFITSFGSLCVTCASSVYTSTYAQMNAEFGCSKIVATIGLSTFVLGIAMGPAWSPLSEFYGRRPIYLVSFALFAIWVIPSAVAQNIETMIIARFFQGLSGSAFLSVSGGTVGDLFASDEMSVPMALFTLAPFVGPSLGPLIGGFINFHVYWRWTHWVLFMWAVALLIALAVFVPETFHPVILRKKAQRLRKETGDERYKAPIERVTKSIPSTVGHSLLRPFQMLISEPICVALDVYSAILLGILYLFFGAFPLVFGVNHGFNLWQIGPTFLGLLVGMCFGVATTPYWDRVRHRLIAKLEKETGIDGISEPEFYLPQVIAGGIIIPIGLFWFAWTTYSSIHWIVPIIGSGVFAVGNMLVFKGIFTYLVDAYSTYSASALATNVFVRCAFAAAFPLFGIEMYDSLGYQWATSVLAFMTVAMLPFPFIFFYYGKSIRSKSKYATKS
ncbi:hypothetical protein MCOR27_006980 [Pyricularia oryzae]|uniref:Major facilitator superfamily (MFS) profile domain-containing protein n=1 Tax=Pyricularia grisea TaxID=148305 RepID=A0ABQ8NA52_PYRGI|nr:hypothetical protein MCOR01_004339 [Pyricularia oryzae]KAI6292897.1 hypothetical protein MCOR33_009509 [Pyricularia grisea]KAI6263531.1 hypothetical protein MCOR19_000168 [Pyricularia oryzae]KAI6275456.1 hypothetical protein MCOR27_006980 [Pyricularia oryzae]KAI6283844.1 hypothetical protein MCOR26_002249 [Pyricularia oryzae]